MQKEEHGTEEEIAAPEASPWGEDAGRHGGEAGETATGAPGLRGGPGPGAAPGMAGTARGTGVMPPEGEAAQEGDEVRLTGMTVKVVPPEEADETLKKKTPPSAPP